MHIERPTHNRRPDAESGWLFEIKSEVPINGNGWIYGPHLRGHWEGDKFVLGSYVKHPQNSSNKAFFKRVSNKKVRRSNGVPAKGNGYRKIFDYWWTID